jgi:hypothetical protein
MEFHICKEKTHWDSFVSTSPQGNIFCCTKFLDALLDEYELFTLTENGEIILGAVVMRRGDISLKAPYPLTMYQGALCSRKYDELPYHKRPRWLLEFLNLLFMELESRYKRISFSLFHTFDDIRPFQWFHYHEPALGTFSIVPRYTGILDLAGIHDFEKYLAQVRTVRRQEYNKALRDGFTVELTDDIELLNRLHGETFERQGISRSHEEERLVLNISKAALESSFGELLVCRDRYGIPASATLFLFDHRYGYYHFGANAPEFRKSGAGTLLLMENIRRCIDKNLAGVDFVGINSPNRGDFKTSFNARPVVYFDVDCLLH